MLFKYDVSSQALFSPQDTPALFNYPFQPGQRLPNWGKPGALCAELSRLAYFRFESSAQSYVQTRMTMQNACAQVGLTRLGFFSHSGSGTEAFGAVDQGARKAYIAFRGSQPLQYQDYLTDLMVALKPHVRNGRVHTGFSSRYLDIQSQVQSWLNQFPGYMLTLTGHSLGGALATVAAAAFLDARLVTFGSPRVGDVRFANLFRKRAVERYVNCLDGVSWLAPPPDSGEWLSPLYAMPLSLAAFGVVLPPNIPIPIVNGYRHLPDLRYIDCDGNLRTTVGSIAVGIDFGKALAMHLTRRPLAKLPRMLTDHSMINYISALA